MRTWFYLILTSHLLLTACATHQHTHDHSHAPTVVSDSEKKLGQIISLNGPKETKGVDSVVTLAGIDLGSEFEAMQGRQLRARELVIAPGGVVAVHQHQQRPAVVYILEGQLVEHRSDSNTPFTHKNGSVTTEKTGVVHWWENTSNAPARALVIDIIPNP